MRGNRAPRHTAAPRALAYGAARCVAGPSLCPEDDFLYLIYRGVGGAERRAQSTGYRRKYTAETVHTLGTQRA